MPAPSAAELGPARIWCSDRRGGVSRPPYDECNVGDHVGDDAAAVTENRRRFAQAAGLPDPTQWVWMNQVHGATVLVASAPTTSVADADAAVTTEPGLPLAVLTADCAPIVLACDGAVAVVHAGHRGLVNGVIDGAVAELRAAGTGEVRAFLGPCIRPAHYEFGADDLARIVDVLGDDVATRTESGQPALDIPAAVRVSLARAGVDSLDDCGIDTAASHDHFSYRRDGTTGRQVTVAVLR